MKALYRRASQVCIQFIPFLSKIVGVVDRLIKRVDHSKFMSGSCHLDSVSNVEIGVECQILFIVIFFKCGQVLQFGVHSKYYKGALTQKRSFSDLIFMLAEKIKQIFNT